MEEIKIIEEKKEKELIINTKILCMLSKAIDKMGISKNLTEIKVETGNNKADIEAVGSEVLALIISNLYKAQEEIIEIVSEIKGISKEEAEKVDIIPLIKELLHSEKIKSFLE